MIESFGMRIRGYSQLNQGVARARNRGAQLAKGDVLVFLDADGYVKPGLVEPQLPRLTEHLEAAVIHTGSELVDEHGGHLGTNRVPTAARAFANTVLLNQP